MYKSIKLSDQPTMSELIKQLNIVTKKWDYINTSNKNLEIELTRKTTRGRDKLTQDMYPVAREEGQIMSRYPLISYGRIF